MNKKICIVICLLFTFLFVSCKKSCKNDDIISLDNNNNTFYLDDDIEEVLKNIKLKVTSKGKDVYYALNDSKVVVEDFNLTNIGEFTAKIKYNKQEINYKYNVMAKKWDKTIDVSWFSQDKNEFEIKNAKELAGLAQIVNSGNNVAGKVFNLKCDIDLDKQEWTPIGTNGRGVFESDLKTFSGIFNGNNHTIYGLSIKATVLDKGNHIDEKTSYYHAGLFGYIKDAEIKNLTINDVYLVNGMGNGYVRSIQGTGAFAGYASGNSKLESLMLKGDVIISGEYRIGGIVGSCGGENIDINNITINPSDKSVIYGSDELYKDTSNYGGVIGFSTSDKLTIKNVITNINVNGFICGGIVGNLSDGTLIIENVAVYKDVYSLESTSVGGIVGGRYVPMTIKNCYVLGKVMGKKIGTTLADAIVSKYGTGEYEIIKDKLYFVEDELDGYTLNTLDATPVSKQQMLDILPDSLKIH